MKIGIVDFANLEMREAIKAQLDALDMEFEFVSPKEVRKTTNTIPLLPPPITRAQLRANERKLRKS